MKPRIAGHLYVGRLLWVVFGHKLVVGRGGWPIILHMWHKHLSKSAFVLISHSQTSITFQCRSRSLLMFLASRLRLVVILWRQNSVLVPGTLPFKQECPCQKHPFMNMMVLKRGNTISGLPGKYLACKRNLRPVLCNAFRRRISGEVFLPWIEAILALRSFGERKSAKGSPVGM